MLVNIAFYLTWIALLAGPVAGAALVWKLRSSRDGVIQRLGIIGITLVAIVGLAFCGGFQTFSPVVNFGFCLTAFLAYCFLASAMWTLRPRALGVATGVIAYATLIPCYILGTVGALALIFILGDYLSPPIHVELTRPGLFCRITGWGAAFSDEGYDVHIYRYPPWFPVVRREIAKVRVDETDPGDGPSSATCAGVAASLR